MASKDIGSIEKISIRTKSTIKEICTFTWVIKNFNSYSSGFGAYIESPHFYTDTNRNYEWSVDIFPDGCNEKTQNYVGIRAYLFHEQRHVYKNFAFKCSMLDKYGKECFVRLVEVKYRSGWIRDLVSKNNLLNKPEFLPDGELRVACEILDLSETCEGEEHSQNMQLEICKTLFDTKKFNDFKLLVQGKEFCVHRAILSAQSPVFDVMFESNMRETSEGEAHIDDIEAEVMEKLLSFIYTGDIDFENLVEKVLVAADKYQLDLLKSRCEGILVKKLNVDNVYDMLLLADQVNATNLKARTMEFFDENKKELVTAQDFKTSIGSFSKDLLIDVISANALKP